MPPHWSQVEWLHVTDLEALAQLAEDGELDAVALFASKAETPERFDWFLGQRFGSVRFDRRLAKHGLALIREASIRYFGRDLSPVPPETTPEVDEARA